MASTSISLQTKIAYPRNVSVGETYLLSIDLDHSLGPEEWPYANEEYPVTCFVDAAPYFIQKAESDATVIVSRFGGSYGPARFWLTARKVAKHKTDPKGAGPAIDILLVNANGMPIHRVRLDEIKLRAKARSPAPAPSPRLDPRKTEPGKIPKPKEKAQEIERPSDSIFRWMHLGDLQFRGTRNERPNVASAVCEWVKKTGNPIHALIVSGDISRSGQRAEFDQASDFLRNITSSLADVQGRRPYPRLVVIPGNHDRTPSDSLELPTSAQWNVDSPQRQQFWADSTRRQDFQRAFEPFVQWRRGMETLGGNSDGFLPGDFARTMTIDGLRVGIVGLNDCVVVSPWSGARADVHPAQIQKVCGDVGKWAQNHDLRILVTHHHPESLIPELYETFYRDFAPRQLFDIHLFGSTKYESRDLRLHTDGAHASAALNAARLNGREPQGFRIGEARVRGPDVNVRLLSFDTSRWGGKFNPAKVQTAKLGRRPKTRKISADPIEDNVQVILPAPLVSSAPVGARRAIVVGLDKPKVGATTAEEALSNVLMNLGFESARLLTGIPKRKQVFAAQRAMLGKSRPEDLLVYFCAEVRNSRGNVASDELFAIARSAERRLLIVGDIAPPTDVPAGGGIIRELAMRMKIGRERYGVAAVIEAFQETRGSKATIGELFAAIAGRQNFKRRVYRKWIRAHLTEEIAKLEVAGTPRTAPVALSPSSTGYVPDFLGFSNPLPRLQQPSAQDSALLLHYLHFSVLLNPQRRMAWFGAVNVDFQQRLTDDDEIDWERWRHEPRVTDTQQLNEDVFRRSLFDHARLVKRMMPAWGKPSLAGDAFGDTGHYTNLMPLMSAANQNPIWRALPDHILKQRARGQRMCFFSGALFSENDPEFRGVKIPAMCWMVFAFTDHFDRPTSAAFLTAQLDVKGTREHPVPLFNRTLPKTPQVMRIALGELQRLSGVDFGVLNQFDVSANVKPLNRENELPGVPVSSIKSAIPEAAPHGNLMRAAKLK